MAVKRIIMHIDMNSYFATVEQQANPLLRGKPIVVSGKEGSRSIIVASSREAKLLGVKTGLLQHEARALCPELIFVEPDGAKYDFLHRQFVDIFKRFTDKVQIFSIDEAFLDVSFFCSDFAGAIVMANEIKQMIRTELGEWVSCSVGIAENKLLAKLASDLQKPDGLVVIDESNKWDILDKVKLTDFCGIGRRIGQRLDLLGIDSVRKLREFSVVDLVSEFGPVCGNRLHQISLGLDEDEVVSFLNEEEVKSISRAYTLPANTCSKDEILVVLLHLIEAATKELRSKNLFGKTIVVYLRYDNFTHCGIRQSLAGYTNNSSEVFSLARQRIMASKLKRPVRLVGIYIANLLADYAQLPLWSDDRQRKSLDKCFDKINDRYGELTIKPALLLKLQRLKHKVGGFRPSLRD